ncbi:MAG: hypothetical protein HW419_3212 [Deltaproteobacteria bacterium]|nr:hypothetical protein [Deltaproteobacteria bacterium]
MSFYRIDFQVYLFAVYELPLTPKDRFSVDSNLTMTKGEP